MPKSREPKRVQRIRAAQQKNLTTRVKEYLKDSFSTPDKALQFLLMLTDKPDIGPATLASRIPYVFFPAAATALSGGTAGILMLLMMIGFVFYGGIHDFIQKEHAQINELKVGSIPEMYAHALEESEINSDGYGHDTNIGKYLDAFHEIEQLEDEIANLQSQHDALVVPPQNSSTKKDRSNINKQKYDLIRDIKNKQNEIDAHRLLIKTEEEEIQKGLDQSQQLSQKKFLLKVDFDNHRIIAEDNPNYKSRQPKQLAINEDEVDLEAQPLLAKSNNQSDSLPFFKQCIDTLGPYIGMGINFIALGAMTNWLVWWGGKLGFGDAADGFIGSSIINSATIAIPTAVAIYKVAHVIDERSFKKREPWSHIISAHEKEKLEFVAKLDTRSIFRIAFSITKESYGNISKKLDVSSAELPEQIEDAPTIDSYLTEDWRKHLSRLAIFDRGPRGMYVLTQFAVAGAASILGWLATCFKNKTLADAASSATEVQASFVISIGVAIATAIVHGYEKMYFDNQQLPADIQNIFDTPMHHGEENRTLRDEINHLSVEIEKRLQAIEQFKNKLADKELQAFEVDNLDDVIQHLRHNKSTALTVVDLIHESVSSAGSYIYILRSVLGLIFNKSTFDSDYFYYGAIPIGLLGIAIRLATCYSERHEARKHDIVTNAHEIYVLLKEQIKKLDAYLLYLAEQESPSQKANNFGIELIDTTAEKKHIHLRASSDASSSDDDEPYVPANIPSHPRVVGVF